MTCGIYGIRNNITDKWYVGQSVDINHRFSVHFYHLRKGNHKNKHLQASFSKYGESSFEKHKLEECSVEHLIETEQKWINLKDAYNSGFNQAPVAGSNLGVKYSETAKTNMRKLTWSSILDNAKKCEDYYYFRLYYPGSYLAACRMNRLDELMKFMNWKLKTELIWDDIVRDASNSGGMGTFRMMHFSTYNALRKAGRLGELSELMNWRQIKKVNLC